LSESLIKFDVDQIDLMLQNPSFKKKIRNTPKNPTPMQVKLVSHNEKVKKVLQSMNEYVRQTKYERTELEY
jgi:hypothetical protein